METRYAVTIDTEEEWDWDSGWPTGRPSVANIGRLPRFQEVCSHLGAATTYFANLAVLDDPVARGIGVRQSLEQKVGLSCGRPCLVSCLLRVV
jgi:hypothetical protein